MSLPNGLLGLDSKDINTEPKTADLANVGQSEQLYSPAASRATSNDDYVESLSYSVSTLRSLSFGSPGTISPTHDTYDEPQIYEDGNTGYVDSIPGHDTQVIVFEPSRPFAGTDLNQHGTSLQRVLGRNPIKARMDRLRNQQPQDPARSLSLNFLEARSAPGSRRGSHHSPSFQRYEVRRGSAPSMTSDVNQTSKTPRTLLRSAHTIQSEDNSATTMPSDSCMHYTTEQTDTPAVSGCGDDVNCRNFGTIGSSAPGRKNTENKEYTIPDKDITYTFKRDRYPFIKDFLPNRPTTKKTIGSPQNDRPFSPSTEPIYAHRTTDDIADLILEYAYGIRLEEADRPLEVWNTVNRCVAELSAVLDINHIALDGAQTNSGQKQKTAPESANPPSHGFHDDRPSGAARKRRSTQAKGSNYVDNDGVVSDSDDDGEPPGRRSNQQKKARIDDSDFNYACPFRKRNPLRFNIRDHPPCANAPHSSMTLLKRHVRTFHKPTSPRLLCPRCKKGMATNADLETHLNVPATRMCEFRPSQSSSNVEDGITPGMDNVLTGRKTGLKVDTWNSLWQTLFPADDNVPSSQFEPPIELYEVEREFALGLPNLNSQLQTEACQLLSKLEDTQRMLLTHKLSIACRDFVEGIFAASRQKHGVFMNVPVVGADEHLTGFGVHSRESQVGRSQGQVSRPILKKLPPRTVDNLASSSGSSLSSSYENVKPPRPAHLTNKKAIGFTGALPSASQQMLSPPIPLISSVCVSSQEAPHRDSAIDLVPVDLTGDRNLQHCLVCLQPLLFCSCKQTTADVGGQAIHDGGDITSSYYDVVDYGDYLNDDNEGSVG